MPPVANNDSASVIQPYNDTIRVTANDTSFSGDSFCIAAIYGSPYFSILDCNSLIYKSDSAFVGNDTAWYVVCNNSQPGLCDTAMVVIAVKWHYTPFMLNNSKWVVYRTEGS